MVKVMRNVGQDYGDMTGEWWVKQAPLASITRRANKSHDTAHDNNRMVNERSMVMQHVTQAQTSNGRDKAGGTCLGTWY